VETQSIVVLDFGAQYSQLIARRIREQKIFSVVLPFNASLEEIRSYSPVGIILSGGPSSVYDQDDMAWNLYQWQGTGPWGGRCG